MNNIWKHILTVSCICLCTSCYNDDPDNFDPDMAIRFSPAVTTSAGTKASAYPTAQPFKVWAFSLENNKSWNENAGTSLDWITNDDAEYAEGVWRPASRKLWDSKDRALTFFAYAPSRLGMNFDKSSGLSLSQFNTLTDHTDILYTEAIADVAKIASGGEVAIPFKHALSKVSFRMVSKGNTYVGMHIKSVSLGNVAYKGNFQSVPMRWETGSERTVLEFCEKEIVLTTDEQPLASFLVIPQDGQRPLTVTYDLYVDGKKELVDQRLYALPILTTWSPGNEYIYTLEITKDEVIYKTSLFDGYVNQ